MVEKFDIEEELYQKLESKKKEMIKIHPHIIDILDKKSDIIGITQMEDSFLAITYKDPNNKNKRYKIKCNATYIGRYSNSNKLWYWCWITAGVSRIVQEQIKNYCNNIVNKIDNNYENAKDFEDCDLIRFFYSNGIFNCNNESLSVFIPNLLGESESLWYVTINDGHNTQVYFINDIKQFSG